MPAFGFLLILIGIFVLVNVFNGNLIDLVQGKITLNFTPQGTTKPALATGAVGAATNTLK